MKFDGYTYDSASRSKILFDGVYVWVYDTRKGGRHIIQAHVSQCVLTHKIEGK